ncbi:hypothetical protein A0J61_05193 [Choanephora cucurbitarum]|uniref:Uncharacterized protein n=1 Tax=Choanephora cucurbitarum TaxID=101091 RepID=A0A1C7NDX3_9FUNG|nr:hypothetical protein A0J61_05193 [Choanephora cucurbitarum]
MMKTYTTLAVLIVLTSIIPSNIGLGYDAYKIAKDRIGQYALKQSAESITHNQNPNEKFVQA